MAKWNLDDYANGAMVIVGVALMAHSVYEAHKLQKREDDRREANRWIDQASARMNCMVDHMLANRASKECFKEALTASKNVLAYEVREVLGESNAYMTDALVKMYRNIDSKLEIIN